MTVFFKWWIHFFISYRSITTPFSNDWAFMRHISYRSSNRRTPSLRVALFVFIIYSRFDRSRVSILRRSCYSRRRTYRTIKFVETGQENNWKYLSSGNTCTQHGARQNTGVGIDTKLQIATRPWYHHPQNCCWFELKQIIKKIPILLAW